MGRGKVSLTDAILFLLEKTVKGGELVLETSEEMRNWIYEGVWDMYPKKVEKGALSNAIRRLRERGFIEQERKEAQRIALRLTQAGKEFVTLKKDEEDLDWDGKWRLVIFDIPESKRLIRDILRSRLINWGFKPWQKSVWASKKNLAGKLRDLMRELGITDYVLVIESENTGK